MIEFKNVYLLQLGTGKVGQSLIDQISEANPTTTAKYNINLIYSGIFNSRDGQFEANGLKSNTAKGLSVESSESELKRCIRSMPKPFILIDATSSDDTAPIISYALDRGCYAVVANKRPLAGTQESFEDLMIRSEGRLLFETTVGAGLPIINTIQSLMATGDEIQSIEGCFSGTLGFLLSRLQSEMPFSTALYEAMGLGFTESDPREDLSGKDVMRKALILARLIGVKIEPENIELTSLFPEEMAYLSVEDFMQKIPSIDTSFAQKVTDAKKSGRVLRYIASISQKACKVSLTEVDLESDIGGLNGPDNIIVIKTKRYRENPLVIKGPGAGPEVTAAGIFNDIMRCMEVV